MSTTVKQALVTFGIVLVALIVYERWIGPAVAKKV